MHSARQARDSHITTWKIVVLAVCLCVFLFGLHAKLAQYQAPSPSVTNVVSAKLWQGDSRMELFATPVAVGFLFIAFLLQLFPVETENSVPLPLWATPAPVRLSTLAHLRRFFRPPPAR